MDSRNIWHKIVIFKKRSKKEKMSDFENWLYKCIKELLQNYYVSYDKLTLFCKNTGNKIYCKILFEYQTHILYGRWNVFSPVIIDISQKIIKGTRGHHYERYQNQKYWIPLMKILDSATILKDSDILNNYLVQLNIPLANSPKVLYNIFIYLKNYHVKSYRFRKDILLNIAKLPNELIMEIVKYVYDK